MDGRCMMKGTRGHYAPGMQLMQLSTSQLVDGMLLSLSTSHILLVYGAKPDNIPIIQDIGNYSQPSTMQVTISQSTNRWVFGSIQSFLKNMTMESEINNYRIKVKSFSFFFFYGCLDQQGTTVHQKVMMTWTLAFCLHPKTMEWACIFHVHLISFMLVIKVHWKWFHSRAASTAIVRPWRLFIGSSRTQSGWNADPKLKAWPQKGGDKSKQEVKSSGSRL